MLKIYKLWKRYIIVKQSGINLYVYFDQFVSLYECIIDYEITTKYGWNFSISWNGSDIKHMRRIPMRIMLNPSENYLKSHKVSNESIWLIILEIIEVRVKTEILNFNFLNAPTIYNR